MRNSMNPYGGVNPLIDKMIGNAYDIVKYVAKYLREIRYVAENMEYVYTAANGNRTILTQLADGSGDPITIALPDGLTVGQIESINVTALYDDDVITMPAPDTFEFNISGGNINIELISILPQVVSATYKVTIVSTPTE